MADGELTKIAAVGLPTQPAVKLVTVENPGPAVSAPPVDPPAGAGISENPGVVSESTVSDATVPTTKLSGRLATLRKEMATLRDLGGTDGIPATLAMGWRTDRSLIEGERNHVYVQRYPNLGSLGIMQHFPTYVGNAGQVVNINLIHHDMDIRWYARPSTETPGHKMATASWVEKALADTEDKLNMISSLARMRGFYFEGKVALSLAELAVTRSSQGGYSAVGALVRILGYLLSLELPADDGLLGYAAIPCDAPLNVGGNFFPGSPAPVPAPGIIPTYFITLALWNDVLHGKSPLPHGFPVSAVGSKVAVVPAPLSRIGQADALACTVLGQMHYPVKNIHRRGALRDWNGDLVDALGVAQESNWYPTSTLVTLPGIQAAAAANSAMVIFILIEDYATTGPWPSLVISGVGNVPLINQWPAPLPAAVNFQLFLAHMFQVAHLEQLQTSLLTAQDILVKYWGASVDVYDALSFWQSALTVMRPAAELSAENQRGTILSPAGASARGWVGNDEEMIPTVANRYLEKPCCTPTNAVGMWPSCGFTLAAGASQPRPNLTEWYYPPTDPLLVLALSAGLIAVADAPEGKFGLTPRELVRTAVHGSYLLAIATDLIWTMNDVPRSLLWVQQRGPVNGDQRRMTCLRQDEFWGRRGRPITEGLPFGALMSKYVFEGRIICDYPANGVYLTGRANIPAGFGSGTQILARVDLPSLSAYTEELPLSADFTLNFGKLADKYTLYTRTPQRNRRDVGIGVPSIGTGGWDLSWDLATNLDGIGANTLGFAVYRDLQTAPADLLSERSELQINKYSPLTWGGLLSIGDAAVIQGLIDFVPSSWSLTMGRPLGSYDPGANTRLALVITSPNLAYGTGRRDAARVAYYVQVGTSRYDAYGPEPGEFSKQWSQLKI